MEKEITKPQERTLSPYQEKMASFKSKLEAMKTNLIKALPRGSDVNRLIRVTLTAVQENPKLLNCEMSSLLMAVLKTAQLGLEPELGDVYFVPFGNKVQFIIGYKGLINLAVRGGEIVDIIAKEIREADRFEVEWAWKAEGKAPFIHKPDLKNSSSKVTHFWAMAVFKSGYIHWDYMPIEEVSMIRDRSKAYSYAKNKESTPWSTDFVAMGKKTIIRRMMNTLPLSATKNVSYAIKAEDAIEEGKDIKVNEHGEVVVLDGEFEEDLFQEEKTIDTSKKNEKESLIQKINNRDDF